MNTVDSGSFARGRRIVVAAILIVILVVLLGPYAYDWIRGPRNQRQCMSNIKQLWAASMMYAEDSDGWMPPYTNIMPTVEPSLRGGTPAPDKLHAVLSRYVKSKSVFFCPSDWYAGKDASDRTTTSHAFSSYRYSFYRAGLLRSDGVVDKALPERYRGYGSPKQFWLICDDDCYDRHGNRAWGPHPGGAVNRIYLDGYAIARNPNLPRIARK